MRTFAMARVRVAGAICLAGIAVPAVARADEPIAATEPRMMSETAEITSVVDAFDKDDPFDLNLTVGFEQAWKHANIRRETTLNQQGLTQGGFTNATENIGSYSQSTSTLLLGMDVGLWRDLALIARVPIILGDSQSIGDLDGSSKVPQILQDSNGQQLFSVPFQSPTRSGIDWFSVGLDWGILNQQRDPTKPTWVVGVEGRFGVGTPLHACNANAQAPAVECPDVRHVSTGTSTPVNRSPGISRAMDTIGAHTTFSKRYGYVEPYSGIAILADFPQGTSPNDPNSSDYGASTGLQGNLENHPPLVGTFTLGMEIVPYERREQFQRFILDFRAIGTYHSEGRDYTELFDALGSTPSRIMQSPNPGGYHANAAGVSVQDPSQQKVYFTGITDQLQYASLGGRFGVTWQAGEYIKFNAGVGLTYNQSHIITADQACNPSINNNPAEAGPCFSQSGGTKTQTGIPNPNYRPTIDVPGNRFVSDDGTIVNLWIMGVVMF